jgi:hypothetical protein
MEWTLKLTLKMLIKVNSSVRYSYGSIWYLIRKRFIGLIAKCYEKDWYL